MYSQELRKLGHQKANLIVIASRLYWTV